MINKETYLARFKDAKEKLMASKILDKVNICLRDHTNTFTDFINMYSVGKYLDMVSPILGLSVHSFGGYMDSERKIIGFCPQYRILEETDFPILPMEITLKTFNNESISHRDYLGSILGLGIDRSKVGDILTLGQGAIVFVCPDIAFYILNNLLKVKNSKAQVREITLEEVALPEPKIKEISSTVSSLRADNVLSSGFQLSRSKAVELIKTDKSLINGTIANPSSSVKEGDFLTLRGLGRIQLVKIKGKTKKDRISIVIHRYI